MQHVKTQCMRASVLLLLQCTQKFLSSTALKSSHLYSTEIMYFIQHPTRQNLRVFGLATGKQCIVCIVIRLMRAVLVLVNTQLETTKP